jgi:hypothetical protein
MKAFIVIVVFTALAVPLAAQHNFRDVKWGMSAEQVRRAEKAKLNSLRGGDLLYEIELFDTRCLIAYSFVDGKLFRAGYVTDEYYMNDALYFETYEKFKNAVAQKYGKPGKEVRYVPDSYKDDAGTGLAKGVVFYYAYWDLGDIEILLMVDGGEKGQHVRVDYTDKELKRIAELKTEENVEEQF